MSEQNAISRRQFVTRVGTAAAGFMIVPRHVLGRGFTAPSDLFNVAGVGVGARGRQVLYGLSSQNVVALCDVDWGYVETEYARIGGEIERMQKGIDTKSVEVRVPSSARNEGAPPQVTTRPMTAQELAANSASLARIRRFNDVHVPKAARYTDFRVMLEKQKDIDGVVVATPDHMHATIALAAMAAGKHVYVEKPLTWSIGEARLLAKKAASMKITTQMGNQGRSLDDTRVGIEYLQSGAIGDVQEVHIWTNRPLGFWPQGIPRPAPLKDGSAPLPWNGPGINTRLAAGMSGNYPMPKGLEWDIFLGPAPFVEYHPVYHPFNWRGWVDWGVGPIGDMGAHLLDVAMWGLELGLPTTIETVSTPFNGVTYPNATTTFYTFPGKNGKPGLKMTWYDGGLMPPKPVELGDEELNKGGGALFIGSKGKLMHDTYGANPRLLPQSLHDSAGKPPVKFARVPEENHQMNWVDAAKGKAEATSPFSYAAKLTEVMLLGCVSLRAGKRIHYDGEAMKVTNDAAANEFLMRQPRKGWTIG